jgi:hypothetical protein
MVLRSAVHAGRGRRGARQQQANQKLLSSISSLVTQLALLLVLAFGLASKLRAPRGLAPRQCVVWLQSSSQWKLGTRLPSVDARLVCRLDGWWHGTLCKQAERLKQCMLETSAAVSFTM